MVEFYSEILVRIAVVFFALWIGGLATTVYGRLPNDIPIGPTNKPMCDYCGSEIKFKHFFPIFGYLLSKGRCSSCGNKIPMVYLLLELVITIYVVAISFQYSVIDERFIAKSICGAYLIVLLFVYHTHKKIKSRLVWMLVAFLLVYRGYTNTLPDVVNLFICSTLSYITFFIYTKRIQIDKPEFIMCCLLVTAMGPMIAGMFLISSCVFWLLRVKPSNSDKQCHIDRGHIITVPIILALLLTFLI